MIFLLLGILESIVTFIIAVFLISTNNLNWYTLILLVGFTINCILLFTLFNMSENIKQSQQELTLLRDSLNECREKLNLPILQETKEEDAPFAGENASEENECPSCFHKISETDVNCPNCGYKLK